MTGNDNPDHESTLADPIQGLHLPLVLVSCWIRRHDVCQSCLRHIVTVSLRALANQARRFGA